MRLLFRDLEPSFPYNSFKIMRLKKYNVFGDTFQNYAPTTILCSLLLTHDYQLKAHILIRTLFYCIILISMEDKDIQGK
jgi:hypothetical protein